jgi:hypothetical protein
MTRTAVFPAAWVGHLAQLTARENGDGGEPIVGLTVR